MTYTLTNWTNISNPQQMLAIANTNTGGYFWVSMIFTFFAIMVISLINFGWEVSILTSAFVCLVVSILLGYLGLVGWSIVGIFVGLIIAMVMYIIWSNRYD